MTDPIDQRPPPAPGSSTRFYILDLVRITAILVMIVGHTLDALVTRDELDITIYPWCVWSFMRGLTAPLFLLVSGAVQIFANERDATGRLLRRVIVRRVRWFLLLIVVGYIMAFPLELLRPTGVVSDAQWFHFTRVHILQLIGVTGLGYILVMALTRSNATFALWTLAIGAAISLATPLVHNVDFYRILPPWAGNYLGSHEHLGKGALFPIFPYSTYMFLGAGIGWFLKQTAPEKRSKVFCLMTLCAGLALSGAGRVGWILFDSETFWHSHPCVVILRTGLCLLIMSLIGLVYRVTRRFEKLYARVGKKALHIFVVHIIILYGGPGFAGLVWFWPRTLTVVQGAGVALGIIVICVSLALIVALLQERWKKRTPSTP